MLIMFSGGAQSRSELKVSVIISSSQIHWIDRLLLLPLAHFLIRTLAIWAGAFSVKPTRRKKSLNLFAFCIWERRDCCINRFWVHTRRQNEIITSFSANKIGMTHYERRREQWLVAHNSIQFRIHCEPISVDVRWIMHSHRQLVCYRSFNAK